jgi:hypothetical protein
MVSDLNDIIRQAIADNPDEQPLGLAKLISDALKPAARKAYLTELLEMRIKDFIRAETNSARNAALDNKSTSHPSNWSPRYADARSHWQRMLDSKINVNGFLKRNGTSTREELMAQIEERQRQIGNLEHQVAHFAYLVNLLDTYQATTLDEVPAP